MKTGNSECQKHNRFLPRIVKIMQKKAAMTEKVEKLRLESQRRRIAAQNVKFVEHKSPPPPNFQTSFNHQVETFSKNQG